MDRFDTFRRCRTVTKRIIDGCFSTRRSFLTIVIVFGLLLYVGPTLFRWLRQKTPILIDPSVGCVSQYIDPLYRESLKYQATLVKSYDDHPSFLPYIGNGKLGFALNNDNAAIYIFQKRSLTFPLGIFPIISVDLPGANHQEGTGVHYTTGVAYKFKCFNQRHNTVELRHELFAHRVHPSIIVQNLRIKNPLNEAQTVLLKRKAAQVKQIQKKTFTASDAQDYELLSFKTLSPDGKKKIIVTVAMLSIPDSITVEAKNVKNFQVLTSVQYIESGYEERLQETIKILETKAKDDIKKALALTSTLKSSHVQVWQQLWNTGFGISDSKAQDVVNGDKINATIYYVLSNTRSYLSEASFPKSQKEKLLSLLAYPESCYNGLYTLQASTLWSHLSTIDDVNKVVALWMLTLEKQGCQELLKTGAEGVIQAMTLSFGSLRFTNHHLEFLSNPGDLHRDYFFRRISYGNGTHLNISVIVGADNKAVLQVAVDRSDRDYYACDAGCLDPPVKLSSKLIQFPVKKTEPITAVLYITSDKEHMEELKHTIHVKEVQEAPPHEHHIIALHRHGHQLGGLPALFWVSIAFLIVVFHLFLAKLVYNEYCSGGEKARGRYIV